MNTTRLEDFITTLLDSGIEISVEWNCGSEDELMIQVFANNEALDNQNDSVLHLHSYLSHLLDLSSIRTFHINGFGQIFRENDIIILDGESIVTNPGTLKDWEADDKALEYSGIYELFPDSVEDEDDIEVNIDPAYLRHVSIRDSLLSKGINFLKDRLFKY